MSVELGWVVPGEELSRSLPLTITRVLGILKFQVPLREA
jgi:hypothetical protein